MKHFALLHGYSATNAGDGLLVEATIDALESLYPGSRYTVLARYPETFPQRKGVRYIGARMRSSGVNWTYLRTLWRLGGFDALVAVGGGYLRFGSFMEGLKTALAHGPQLLAAAAVARRVPIIYMPQSVGPAPSTVMFFLRLALRRFDRIFLRDDRSMAELNLRNSSRSPDLALMYSGWTSREETAVGAEPVISTRELKVLGTDKVHMLRELLPDPVGYIQSTGAGNDDSNAADSLHTARILTRDEYLQAEPRRVVVAVRLHAALMGLRAGHWVIHLAYERKGFGAFEDLGLSRRVTSVYRFNPEEVADAARELLRDAAVRESYDKQLATSLTEMEAARQRLLAEMERSISGRSS